MKDLTPFIDGDLSFAASDFYEGLLEKFQWEGGTWALPAEVKLILLLYNRAAFKEAGITPPHPGWTIEEFALAAQQLTVRKGGEVSRYGFISPLSELVIPLILGHADDWIDKSTKPPLPKLDNPAMIKAVKWYVDMALNHSFMPNPAQLDALKMFSLINDGKAAMWLSYSDELWRYMHLNPGLAPLPEGEDIVGWKKASGYAMSGGTTHPQESWQWLAFLTYQPLTRPKGTVPPRRSVAEASGYWEKLIEDLGEEAAKVYEYILKRPQGALSEEPWVNESLLRALKVILTGEQGAKEALSKAQTKALAIITAQEEAARANTPLPLVLVTTPEFEEGKVTIFFYHDGALPLYHILAREFHKEHPKIRIKLTEPKKWGISHWAEECDCFAIYTSGPFRETVLTNHQYFLNLQPFLDVAPRFSVEDFYPQFLEPFLWEGDLLAIPVDGHLRVLYYNKDLFDEAGVSYPRLDWGPGEFLQKAVRLTKGEGEGKIYGYVPLYAHLDLDFFLNQRGATIVDVTSQPPRPKLNDPAVVEVMRWYADMALVYAVMPNPIQLRSEERFSESPTGLISASRAAMWIDYSGFYHGRTPFTFGVGIAPLPVGQGKMSISQHGITAYVISTKSAHSQACWEWIEFLLENSVITAETFPARRSVANSSEYQEQAGDAISVYLFTVEHSDSSLVALYSKYPWLYALRYWLYKAFDEVLSGKEPEEALERVQAMAEAYVVCLGELAASGQEWGKRYEFCAKKVDPGFDLTFEVINIPLEDTNSFEIEIIEGDEKLD